MNDKEKIFRSIKKAQTVKKDEFIIHFCSGKTVLDVGCAGQDHDISNPNWLHGKIYKTANELVGVDTNVAAIKKLRSKGYAVFSPEEILTHKNKKSFDVIIMADVIEHVNDPVDFLIQYSRLLATNGRLVITTPNAVSARNFTSILLGNHYSLNPEHTVWFCPKTIIETLTRAKLQFHDFFWIKEYYSIREVKGLFSKTIFILNSFLFKLRRLYHPNFMLIAKKPENG